MLKHPVFPSLPVCLHGWCGNTAQGPLSALALLLTRFVPGLLMLRVIVISREKLGMLDKQGDASDVTYASWPALCQTSPMWPMAVGVVAGILRAHWWFDVDMFGCNFYCLPYFSRWMCTKLKCKKLVLISSALANLTAHNTPICSVEN